MNLIDNHVRCDRNRAGGVEPMHDSEPAGPEDRFGLDEVDPRTWKVVDRHRPRDDPFRTLALIRSMTVSYEVMQFGTGFEWTRFVSLEEALAHVVATSVELHRIRAAREHDGSAESVAEFFGVQEWASQPSPGSSGTEL